MTPRRLGIPPPPITGSRVCGVVLAAGAGRRMGQPKLLLSVNGRPMLAWVLDLVERLPLTDRVIVLGAEADAIRTALFPPHPDPRPPRDRGGAPPFASTGQDQVKDGRVVWRIVVNENWPEGMGSSLRRAAEVVPDGMLVFLGDMPWVPEEAARAVLARASTRPVAPACRGQRGFPVYLPPSLRPELLRLSGDRGARDLLGSCEVIPWDDRGVVQDVDEMVELTAPPREVTDPASA